MAKQLITRADYARRAGVSRAAVTQWVHRGVIVLHRGKVDPVQADAARQKYIAPRVRPVRTVHTVSTPTWMLRMPVCQGCGGRFGSDVARELGSPDPARFCCDLCFEDLRAGLSPAKVAAKRDLEAEMRERSSS